MRKPVEFNRADMHNLKRACYQAAVSAEEAALEAYREGDVQNEEFWDGQKEIFQELHDRIVWLLDMVY